MKARSVMLSLLSVVLISTDGPLRAQGQGTWSGGFDHQHNVPNVATNAEAPFGPFGPKWPLREVLEDPPVIPQAPDVPTMNALHMALIPVGPHRGKVVVWGRGPFVGEAVPFTAPNVTWSFEAFSIVDPAPNPVGLRFLNFFLPLEFYANFPFPTPPPVPADLFCSGHAWSPFGYLVVTGGTRYLYPDAGADMVWTFDPRYDHSPWPVTNQIIYETQPGNNVPYPGSRWREQPRLQTERYYATATLMHRVLRTIGGQPNQPVDVMLVLGGSVQAGTQGPEWNHYEALQLKDNFSAGGAVVSTDQDINGAKTWWGPGFMGVGQVEDWDWLQEYPRAHFVNGRIFFSSWAPRSATLDHSLSPSTPPNQVPLDQALPWLQRWDLSAGNPIATSHKRESGSSVLFVNYPGYDNLVLRMGGEDEFGDARDTMEGCSASTSGSWTAWSPMAFKREHCNAVILPDASVFVVGGHDDETSHTIPEIYKLGVGWVQQPDGKCRRDYHATAVLLPDGTVLVGGGNNRHDLPGGGSDYQIFTPPYLAGNPTRPAGLTIPNATFYDVNTDTYELDRFGTFTFIAEDMPAEAALSKLVLIPPGSVTHHSDMHQRYVECSVNPVTEGMLQFSLPPETKAPRGYYMAFAVTTGGIPSKALWVRLL